MNGRRSFIQALVGIVATGFGYRRALPRPLPQSDHPDPRPGIDASHVLSPEELTAFPDVVDIYEGIRKIPHIADGIRCRCGCADSPGMRSLLSCYESSGMALSCVICQSEGRMVVRLNGAGRTLDQIRAAVDARFGPRGSERHHEHVH